MKYCKNCGKELPDDSVFCQYCGSNSLEDKFTSEFKEKYNIFKGNDIKDYQKRLKIACIMCIALFVWVILAYYTNNGQKEIKELNNQIVELQATIDTYKTKASKYDKVASSISNQKYYPSFRASSYFVKGASNDVRIYWTTSSGGGTITWTSSTNDISATWGNEWILDGDEEYANLHITCKSGSYGTIKITNSFDNSSYYIFVSGS